MFERTEIEIKAAPVNVWIDQRTANMLNEFAQVKAGWNVFTFNERCSVHALCARILIGGVPSRHVKPIKGFMNSLSWAYGPEYEL